jgi:excisionase family DNA binding protein
MCCNVVFFTDCVWQHVVESLDARGPTMKRSSDNHKTEETMTVSALARYLHCRQATVYRLLKERKIPALELRTDWRFLRSDVDEWIGTLPDTTSPPLHLRP